MNSSTANVRKLTAACGLALLAAAVLHAQLVTAAPPVADPDPARFESEIAAFEAWDRQNSAPANAVLFVGSSSIRMWPTAESFPGLPVINRGFGGSHASDVNHFVDRIVIKYAPRTIVFYAGDNDIADGKSPEQVAGDFRQFAALVHAKFPNTQIIFLPIKPSPSRWQKWPDAQRANGLIQQFVAGDQQLNFVDTATPLLGPDRKPNGNFYRDDQLHLNDDGYKVWNEVLSPYLSGGGQ